MTDNRRCKPQPTLQIKQLNFSYDVTTFVRFLKAFPATAVESPSYVVHDIIHSLRRFAKYH